MTPANVVNIFLDLVQIDSPSGHESEVSKYICVYLTKLGITNFVDKTGNVVASISGSKESAPILLCAHMDTVEPGRGVKPVITDGWITSSGDTILGADNKSAIAIILASLNNYIDIPIYSRKPLELVFTVSEESENIGAANLDYSKLRARSGYLFDSSGSIGDISIAAPAYVRFEIEVIGKTAHASRPQESINVINTLSKLLSYIKTGFIDAETLVNIGTVRAGDSTNSVPGTATIIGEIRSMNEQNINNIVIKFEKYLKKLNSNSKVKILLKTIRENGAINLSATDPFVLDSLKIVRNHFPVATTKVSWGCSDANIFIDHSIVMLNIVDGSMYHHALEETITIDSLHQMVGLVTSLITLHS
ncbi:MAG: M20/M25/M40 family metallo-hydrolase [Microgenomates group bacterium]